MKLNKAHVAPRLIPLGLLDNWPNNPRREPEPQAIDTLARSIQARGLLQPLIGRPTPGDPTRTQIVAGNTRRSAFCLLALEGALDLNGQTIDNLYHIPVIVLQLTDAEALDVAITENTARYNMNPLDIALSAIELLDSGISVSQACKTTGMTRSDINTARLVTKLPESALIACRSGARPYPWLIALTNASRPLQERIASEVLSNQGAYPTTDAVREAIRATRIPVAHALFDLQEHNLSTQTDLLDGSTFFGDPDAFWVLQDLEIEKTARQLETESQNDVTVLRGTNFESWRYLEDTSSAEKLAFIIVGSDGSVQVKRNLRAIKTSLTPPAKTQADAAFKQPMNENLKKILGAAWIKTANNIIREVPEAGIRFIIAVLLNKILSDKKSHRKTSEAAKLATRYQAADIQTCLSLITDTAATLAEILSALMNDSQKSDRSAPAYAEIISRDNHLDAIHLLTSKDAELVRTSRAA